jgi:hypothetical protein
MQWELGWDAGVTSGAYEENNIGWKFQLLGAAKDSHH